MCQKRSTVIAYISPYTQFRSDKCIRHLLESMNHHGFRTVGSCCGHGGYSMTIVCERQRGRRFIGKYYDVVSGIEIPRTRNFYRLDSEGYYYIPEVDKGNLMVSKR